MAPAVTRHAQARMQQRAIRENALERMPEFGREAFVGALTWRLTRIAFMCGLYAAGDIVRRYGEYLANIAAQDSTRREAEDAKVAGKAFR